MGRSELRGFRERHSRGLQRFSSGRRSEAPRSFVDFSRDGELIKRKKSKLVNISLFCVMRAQAEMSVFTSEFRGKKKVRTEGSRRLQ